MCDFGLSRFEEEIQEEQNPVGTVCRPPSISLSLSLSLEPFGCDYSHHIRDMTAGGRVVVVVVVLLLLFIFSPSTWHLVCAAVAVV